MDKLKMQTPNKANDNLKKSGYVPQCCYREH